MSVGARNTSIDVMRGVAILLVLLHHFNIAYTLDDTALSRAFGWPAVHAVVRNGNYGVTLFFVISGFLISSNARARWTELSSVEPGLFYRLRAARIGPCLVLLVAIVNVLAALGLTMFRNHPEAGPAVPFWRVDAAALTFWMNVLMAGKAGWVNYALCVLWSLSVEEVFYLSFPVACLVLGRPAFLAAFWCLFIVLGPVWRGLHPDDEAQFLYAYLASFDGIAVGCCAALLAPYVALRGRWAGFAGAVVGLAMAALYLIRSIYVTKIYGVTLMSLGTGSLLLLAQHRPGSGRRRMAALAWFGRTSYELYLFHLVVLGLIRSAFPEEAGDAKLVLLAVFVAASAGVAALVSTHYAEPLNRKVRDASA